MSNHAEVVNALLLICLSVLGSTFPSEAGSPPTYNIVKTIQLKSHFQTRSDWLVTAYQARSADDADSIADDPAKLCFVRSANKREDCTKITSGLTNNPGFVYNYQTVRNLEIVPLKSEIPAVLFHAQFSGGGSGTAEQISLWTYDRAGDSFRPALIISTNESGQYKIISSGPLAGYVVTADAEWQSNKGETHFSAHQFEITVYRFSGQSYLEVLAYLTTRKYGGEDNSRQSEAIAGEMSHIRALLKAIGQ